MVISYKVVVRSRLTPGKCLKDVHGVMLKVPLGDLLRDLLGESEGIKDVKIGIVGKRKNDTTSENGRIKRTDDVGSFRAREI